MIRQAIILSGREAAGLGALVRDRPRAMLPVLGKPVIARVVERLYRAGVQRFVIILGAHEGQVASTLQFVKPQAVELIFVVQPLASRGLAGALAAAAVHLHPDEPFVLTEADVVVPGIFVEQLLQRFQDEQPVMTLSLAQIQYCAPESFFPVVTQDSRVVNVGRTLAELPA
ncbi:MAG: NDP-sugar synthase, partial [Anaerolineae bacterium]|nr:NDP-sugar synthase [Anaerolineae bacterium]